MYVCMCVYIDIYYIIYIYIYIHTHTHMYIGGVDGLRGPAFPPLHLGLDRQAQGRRAHHGRVLNH